MKDIKSVIVLVAVFLAALGFVCAALPDRRECVDHPLFPVRMPGYSISACDTKDLDAFNLETGKREKLYIEGRCTRLTYRAEDRARETSGLAMTRNYESAIKDLGGTILFMDNRRFVNGKIVKNGKEYWAQAEKGNGLIWLTVVEKTGLSRNIALPTNVFKTEAKTEAVGSSEPISDLQAQIKALEQKLNQTQQQVAMLSQVIKISGMDVEISAAKNLTVNAGAATKIKGGSDLELTSGVNLRMRSSAAASIQSASLSLKSDSVTSIEAAVGQFAASGVMEIKAPTIKLNKGTKPVATVGSSISAGGAAAQVMSGSASVFAE